MSGLSLSRDGRQIAFGSADPRSTLHVADFDPASGVGTPKSILRSELIAGSHISPDGEWVAFTSWGVRESLFVMRSDGSDFRQLTDDKELTRGPHWSPSGREVAFFRSLAGSVDIWPVRPDGSGLRPLSKAGGVLVTPIWSPDGTRIAAVRLPGGPCLRGDQCQDLDPVQDLGPLRHRERPDEVALTHPRDVVQPLPRQPPPRLRRVHDGRRHLVDDAERPRPASLAARDPPTPASPDRRECRGQTAQEGVTTLSPLNLRMPPSKLTRLCAPAIAKAAR